MVRSDAMQSHAPLEQQTELDVQMRALVDEILGDGFAPHHGLPWDYHHPRVTVSVDVESDARVRRRHARWAFERDWLSKFPRADVRSTSAMRAEFDRQAAELVALEDDMSRAAFDALLNLERIPYDGNTPWFMDPGVGVPYFTAIRGESGELHIRQVATATAVIDTITIMGTVEF